MPSHGETLVCEESQRVEEGILFECSVRAQKPEQGVDHGACCILCIWRL